LALSAAGTTMNPEFRRNLWLEMTKERLILVPMIVFGIAYVGQSLLPYLALLGFAAVTVIWGGRQASHSIIEEVRERTWDIQKMSATEPWAMTWGKLIGATSVAWFGGSICLFLYLVSNQNDTFVNRLLSIGIIISATIAVQGAAMAAALVAVHMERGTNARLSNTAILLILVAISFPVLNLVDGSDAVYWYGDPYHQLVFTLISSVLFASWAIIGAYRSMCTELLVRTTPWIWLSFAVFISAYATGFLIDTRLPLRAFVFHLSYVAVITSVIMTYVAALAWPHNAVQYRRVRQLVHLSEYRRALEELPLWTSSALLAVLLSASCFSLATEPGNMIAGADKPGTTTLALVLMMLRDTALLGYLSFHPRVHRPAFMAIFCITILDFLLPAILKVAGATGVAELFMPPLFDTPWRAAAIFGAHAAVTCLLALGAYRATRPQPETR